MDLTILFYKASFAFGHFYAISNFIFYLMWLLYRVWLVYIGRFLFVAYIYSYSFSFFNVYHVMWNQFPDFIK